MANISKINNGSTTYDIMDAKLGERTITATGSTTARSLQARAADVINVKDFGATGDGTTDDTAAIQAAINAASGKMVVGNGTYLVTPLTVVSGVTISGMNFKLAQTESSSSNEKGVLIFAASSTGIKIDSCSFDGNKDNLTGSYLHGVIIKGSDHRIVNCNVYNVVRTGVHIIAGTSRLSISGCTIHDCGRFGIGVSGSASVVTSKFNISNNKIYNTGNAGIMFVAGEGETQAQFSAGCIEMSIVGNIIHDNGLTETAGGIGCYSGNNKKFAIVGNVIYNTTNHGVHAGGEQFSICGNVLYNTTSDAIFVRDFPNSQYYTSSSNVVISGNTIKGGSTTAIRVENANDVVVTGNEISGSGTYGIIARGHVLSSNIYTTRLSISGNTVKGCASDGIRLEYVENSNINGNTCCACARDGIYIVNCENVNVSACNCNGNTRYGISVFPNDDSSNTVGFNLSGNILSDNGSAGIYVRAILDKSVVSGNTLNGNYSSIIAANYDSFTQSHFDSNSGFRLRANGQIQAKDGDVINHYLVKAPKSLVFSPSGNYIIRASNITDTTYTIHITDLSGNAVTENTTVFYMISAEIC